MGFESSYVVASSAGEKIVGSFREVGRFISIKCIPTKKPTLKLCTPKRHTIPNTLLIVLALIGIGGTFLALHLRGAGPGRIIHDTQHHYHADYYSYDAPELFKSYYNGQYWYDFVEVVDELRWYDYIIIGSNAGVLVFAGLSVVAALTRRKAALYLFGLFIILAGITLIVAGKIVNHDHRNYYPLEVVQEIDEQLQTNWIQAAQYDQTARDSLEFWQLSRCCCGLRSYCDFKNIRYIPDTCACVNYTNPAYIPTWRWGCLRSKRSQYDTCTPAGPTTPYNIEGCWSGITDDYLDTYSYILYRQSIAMLAVGGIQVFLALVSLLTAACIPKQDHQMVSLISAERLDDNKIRPGLENEDDPSIDVDDKQLIVTVS